MDALIYAGQHTLSLVLLLSLVPVGVATLVGLIIGVLQTASQIQEQTLPFGLKLIAVLISLMMLSGWYAGQLKTFALELFRMALST